jgi:hypothetical protein
MYGSSNLFQAVKLFTVQLIEFGVDIFDGILCSGNDDMLNCVHCIELANVIE